METPDPKPDQPSPEAPGHDQYRYALPVRFFWPSGMATGRCVLISEHGMLATFDVEPDIWITGSLTAVINERNISLTSRVIRVHAEGVGLSFRINTEKERHELFLLLSAAMAEGTVVPHEK